MTLVLSKEIRNEKNVYYGYAANISSLDDFKKAVIYDHVACLLNGSYRLNKNWLKSNCLMADFDDDALPIEAFIEKYKNYEFYLATSKSHNKEKHGVIGSRYHCYFPITLTDDSQYYQNLIYKLHAFLDKTPDKQAKDISRFFNGNPESEVYYNQGISIENDIKYIEVNTEAEEIQEDKEKYFTPKEIIEYFDNQHIIRTADGYYRTTDGTWFGKEQLLDLTKMLRYEYQDGKTTKSKPIADYFIGLPIDSKIAPFYSRIEFRPDLPQGDNYPIFNIYKPILPDGTHRGDITPILNHIFEVIADGDARVCDYILKWMAHLLQRPYEKPRVAIGIRGERQIGKGIIFENLLKQVLGKYESIFTDLNSLEGNFNIQLRDCLLIYFNEIGWMDRNNIGKMNALITDMTKEYHEKNKTPYQGLSFHRVVITTNADWIVEHKDVSVRWLLTTANPKYKGNYEYFKNLLACINNNYMSFLEYLLDIDISDWNNQEIPITETALEQQDASLSSVERFLKEIETGEITFETERIPNTDYVRLNCMYDRYISFCNEEGYSKPTIKNVFAKALRKIYSIERTVKYSMDSKQERIVNLKLANLPTISMFQVARENRPPPCGRSIFPLNVKTVSETASKQVKEELSKIAKQMEQDFPAGSNSEGFKALNTLKNGEITYGNGTSNETIHKALCYAYGVLGYTKEQLEDLVEQNVRNDTKERNRKENVKKYGIKSVIEYIDSVKDNSANIIQFKRG